MTTIETNNQAVADLSGQLRSAVLQELQSRRLDRVEIIAEALGLLPIAADGLLRRSSWSIETSLRLVAALDLPIRVDVHATQR
jgi:hypothetical protein